MEGIKEFMGKKVYVILKNGRNYQGTIKKNEGDLIILIDKFGELVMFNISEIGSLEEENANAKKKI